MRTITTVALGVLLVVAAGASAQDTKDGKKDKDAVDAKKLIGKWEPKDKKDNVTLEFTKDGKLLLSVEAGGKTNKLVLAVDIAGKVEKLEGTYKLDGNKLSVAINFGGKEQKEEMTVNKLTDDEMETTDSKGKKETMKRVK